MESINEITINYYDKRHMTDHRDNDLNVFNDFLVPACLVRYLRHKLFTHGYYIDYDGISFKYKSSRFSIYVILGIHRAEVKILYHTIFHHVDLKLVRSLSHRGIILEKIPKKYSLNKINQV